MSKHTINSEVGLQSFIGSLRELWHARRYLEITIKEGKGRSVEQNAVMHGWFGQVARELREDDARVSVLRQLAAINAAAGFKALPEAGYLGSHWLGTYAVLSLRASRHGSPQPLGPVHALPPADTTKPQNGDSTR